METLELCSKFYSTTTTTNIVNYYVKICHVPLGDANNMRPLSLGGGDTNGKDPKILFSMILSSLFRRGAKQNIVLLGNPILREKCLPIDWEKDSDLVSFLLSEMKNVLIPPKKLLFKKVIRLLSYFNQKAVSCLLMLFIY